MKTHPYTPRPYDYTPIPRAHYPHSAPPIRYPSPNPPHKSHKHKQHRSHSHSRTRPPAVVVLPAPAPAPLISHHLQAPRPQPASFQYSKCNGRKKALCIGINYRGQRNELRGCINDAKAVREFLIRMSPIYFSFLYGYG
jgi:metacaspase-1